MLTAARAWDGSAEERGDEVTRGDSNLGMRSIKDSVVETVDL